MEAAKYLCVINIVFFLIQFVTYMHAECYVKEYKLLPGGYNIYMQNGVQPVFKSVKLKDINKCGQMCANEKFCNVWRFGLGNCQIFHSMKDNVAAKISADTTVKTYYYTVEDDQWMKIYYGKSGTGIKGTFKTWIPPHCTLQNCPDFFRSFFIEIWSSLPIRKVKLSLFKNNAEVRYMIFDGQGTNSKNWFMMSRVLDSSWKDVYKGATHFHFGVNNEYFVFNAVKTYFWCYKGSGWIIFIDSLHWCQLSHPLVYPLIIYSDKETATVWTTGYSTADALAVYISF